ncbi:MAG: hypothetical protein BRD28_06005 [Bacteroidetes bacterium QH_10_64_37]|jgi:hypothetical protein|nr:MAG: hypothetical protein BRD28_06005 [Bacteroidetes bacterium QH_10_64_37]
MRPFLELVFTGLVLSLSGAAPAHGQSAYDLFGSARASGLGYASTALTTTAGVHANPAAPALHRRRMVSFFAREGFGLSALRYGSVYGTGPARWGVVSGGASTFGGEGYREMQYSLGYARGLQFGTSRHVYVGLTGRYYHTRIDGYGGAGAVGLHLGLLLPILPALHLGAHVTNVNGPSLVDGETLPQTLAVGLQYQVSSRLLLVTDVFKALSFPASVRGGLEVHPIPMLALRAGVTSAPTRFTGGVGLRLDWVRVHVAAEQHAELGWSPSASLELRW